MKVSRFLKLKGLCFLLFVTGTMISGCKDDKAGEHLPLKSNNDETQKELIDITNRNTIEIKAELVGNY